MQKMKAMEAEERLEMRMKVKDDQRKIREELEKGKYEEEKKISDERTTEVNKILLKKFRELNIKSAEAKRNMKVKKPPSELNQRKEKVMPRNPQRLFRMTKSSEIRVRKSGDEKMNSNVFLLENVPQLGIPEWRKGL